MTYMDQERLFLKNREHCAFRRRLSQEEWNEISREIQNPELPLDVRVALRLKKLLETETIVKREGMRIPAFRTIEEFPDVYAPGEKEKIHKSHYIHELGRISNLCSDWEGVLNGGLEMRRGASKAQDMCIDAVLAYADRYEIPELSRALRTGAKDYMTALQMQRILHFCLWAGHTYHNTVGRFDQYMYPLYKKDTDSGLLTKEEALELTEEFFLSFNRDSDLYDGMQQGDNGQSMMLGGCDREGNCAVNDLTMVCLTASLNNHCIDPKINLRVDKNTPMSLFVKATELTRQGLGFPQYANDDVVIPALIDYGYKPEDARDYSVAACWEFIIPGKGAEIPNIAGLSLAGVVSKCVRENLKDCQSYEQFFETVRTRMAKEAKEIEENVKNLWFEPAPWQSVLMSDWSKDVSLGGQYNNYGIHGTGFANAVDQLAVIRDDVFGTGKITKDELLTALDDEFEKEPELKGYLRSKAPKLGREVSNEEIADAVLNAFADAAAPLRNERGGIFRAGTGSAMFYVWHANELPALCDGHMPADRLPANFSPSLLLKDAGPLSVLRSMSCPSLKRAMNGGPVTLELHNTVLRGDEGLFKVAQLVRSYILHGGHQLQLNAVDPEQLKDAMVHPELHANLIVRVWGWSGYFVQLDRIYQEQIIARTDYQSV